MNYFLTKKRFEEFEKELRELKTKRRLEVSERLKEAKELGDLSENSEYLEARGEQERVERRIAELEDILKNVTLIREGGSGRDVVDIGSTVEVARDGKKMKFIIVGSAEAKPEEGFISNQSPLGKELLGKKVGDKVVIEAPSGRIEYKIQKIS